MNDEAAGGAGDAGIVKELPQSRAALPRVPRGADADTGIIPLKQTEG